MFAVSIDDGAELRPLEPWQAPEFAAYIEKHRPHLAPWLPWAARIRTDDAAHEFLQRYADNQASDSGRIYSLWLDGELVGGALFRVWDTFTAACEIGVWISPAAQGRGLITKVSQRLIDWAISERGMNRVEWRCVPHNDRSIAVAQRLGMTREGVLRESFPFNGTYVDVEVWSLLASEHS